MATTSTASTCTGGATAAVLAALRTRLHAAGFDLGAEFRTADYNGPRGVGAASPELHLPAGRHGLLVGHSGAHFWPRFVAHVRERPFFRAAPNPLDLYTSAVVHAAVDDAARHFAQTGEGGGGAVEALRACRVRLGFLTGPGQLVAMQRLAQAAGLAYLNKTCHLCVHPTLGPWLALRAAIVLGPLGDAPPTDPAPPPPPEVPNPSTVPDAVLETALQEALADPSDWARWVSLRRAVGLNTHEYGEAQLRFHYDQRQRAQVLAEACGWPALHIAVYAEPGCAAARTLTRPALEAMLATATAAARAVAEAAGPPAPGEPPRPSTTIEVCGMDDYRRLAAEYLALRAKAHLGDGNGTARTGGSGGDHNAHALLACTIPGPEYLPDAPAGCGPFVFVNGLPVAAAELQPALNAAVAQLTRAA